jgi:hypothetical protein
MSQQLQQTKQTKTTQAKITNNKNVTINTRSASGASLPESANGGQIDCRVVYCLLIYIMLSGEGKYLKIIIYHHSVIHFVMFYTYDVSNRPIPGNIADNE